VFRAGDQSHALFAVRSGCLKTYCTTEDGNEQVLGFTLPGELVGLDGMGDDAYASNSVVLETTSICELPYDRLEEMCHSLSGLNHQLMRLASKEITADQRMQLLLAKHTAEEKLAAFFLSLSTRYKPRGLSATNFNLPMSRQDIGNYLGLAIATVSRLFARFQEEGLLKVNRREITITDLPRLKGMVEGYRKYALTSAS
jgi:CRP/FNR family transcriptional regulator